MEIYLIGLFLLVRDDNNRSACMGQAVIMAVATVMTIGFQVFLTDAFDPCLQFLPYAGNEDKIEKENLGSESRKGNWALRRLHDLIPRNGTSRIWSDVNPEGKYLTPFDDPDTSPLALRHQPLCVEKSVVWIPEDPLGISEDEICRVKSCYGNVRISNENANIDEEGRLTISAGPSWFL